MPHLLRPLALLPLVTAAALAAPTPKDDAVELRWRLAKGDVFSVTLETVTDTRVTPPPRMALAVTSVHQRTTAVWKVTVAAAGKDGVTLDLEAVSYLSGGNANTGRVKPTAVQGAAGRFAFDTRTGRLVSAEETVNWAGTSTGNKQGVEYHSTVTTTATFSAKPPKAD